MYIIHVYIEYPNKDRRCWDFFFFDLGDDQIPSSNQLGG